MTEPIHLTGGDFAINKITPTHVILDIRLPGDIHPIEGYRVSVPLADVQQLVSQLPLGALPPTPE